MNKTLSPFRSILLIDLVALATVLIGLAIAQWPLDLPLTILILAIGLALPWLIIYPVLSKNQTLKKH